MGIFDRLRSAGAPTFDAQRAIMTIVVAAVKADGTVSEEEVLRLRTMCARSPIFASNSKEKDDTIISFADNVTDQLGDSAIGHAAASLQQELRETAFAFACDMVLADGLVGSKEEQYLTGLASTLELSDEVLNAVVLATVIRHRAA